MFHRLITHPVKIDTLLSVLSPPSLSFSGGLLLLGLCERKRTFLSPSLAGLSVLILTPTIREVPRPSHHLGGPLLQTADVTASHPRLPAQSCSGLTHLLLPAECTLSRVPWTLPMSLPPLMDLWQNIKLKVAQAQRTTSPQYPHVDSGEAPMCLDMHVIRRGLRM